MNPDTASVHKAVKKISSLASWSQKEKVAPDPRLGGGVENWYKLMIDLFTGLETDRIKMTPSLANETQLEEALLKIYAGKQNFFSQQDQRRAEALHQRFLREHWGGADEQSDRRGSEDSQSRKKRKASARASAATGENLPKMERSVIRIPPIDDPIFGVNGIMHGVAYRTNAGSTIKAQCLHPHLRSQVKDANVFGSNGLEIGAWFPSKMAAKFHGAHGRQGAGISGDGESGAYAIVVSPEYDDLDRDEGNTLYYSGSGSHDNEDPNNAPARSTGTKALYRSLETGRAVRVLRKDGAKAKYAPSRGLRYDGLYRVVAPLLAKNRHGGLYDQFKLERVEDQKELDEYRLQVPNAKQIRDHDRYLATRIAHWEIVEVQD